MLVFEAPITIPQKSFVWVDIVLTAIFSTALAYGIQAGLQPFTTAGRTGIIFSAEPLFAALFGFIYLGEALQGSQWAGALFIIGAVIIVRQHSLKQIVSSD